MKKETIVISLGGSLIVPGKIDTRFLKRFRSLILGQARQGKKFILICGGGRTARNYQAAARAVGKLSASDVDWIGIHAIKLNAHLLRSIFARQAHPKIIKPDEPIKFSESILIAGGLRPGNSTDYCAVLLAKKCGAKKILNLSNIDFAFDLDPSKYKNAKPIIETTWKNFRKVIPKKWSPGLNAPFDPVASALAQKLGLEVAIINGNNFSSIKEYLDAKPFTGTTIRN